MTYNIYNNYTLQYTVHTIHRDMTCNTYNSYTTVHAIFRDRTYNIE